MQPLIHEIKYHRHPRLARALGRAWGIRLVGTPFHRREACLVPVPLHPHKFRQRGFNQAEWFARGLAEVLALPVETQLLVRNRHTPTQTGLDREGRRRNVEGAFACHPRRAIPACVWVVDDVLTTGATVAEAAHTLQRAGVPEVGVLTLAVVVD